MPPSDYSGRARDHMANERTFLAWVRTGVAIIVFGFAIGRFSIAIREFLGAQAQVPTTAGLSLWFGFVGIVAGVVMIIVGLNRYQKTRAQLDSQDFQPARLVIDVVAIFTVLFGAALAGYLIYIHSNLH